MGKVHPLRGFTLVEVLVALALMAVMATLAWRGIDGMARAQQTAQRTTDDVLALQAGLMQWRADLDAMMSWPGPGGALPATPAGQRSLAWDGSVLRITRTSAGSVDAGLRVVAWMRRGGDGQWLRWQSAPVRSHAAWLAAWDEAARWSQTGAPQGVQPGGAQAVAIASALEWQVRYFRNNAWTNALSSGAESAANVNVLPDGVRLLITLAPGQGLAGALTVDWVRPDFGGAQ